MIRKEETLSIKYVPSPAHLTVSTILYRSAGVVDITNFLGVPTHLGRMMSPATCIMMALVLSHDVPRGTSTEMVTKMPSGRRNGGHAVKSACEPMQS